MAVRDAMILAAALTICVGWLGATSVAAADAAGAAPDLKPYRARYEVSYRGLVGGQIAASLQPASPDRWVYETQAFPNVLGRLAIGAEARERGMMVVTPDGVRPLSYEYDDGKSGDSKDIRLEFDWDAGRVSGSAEGKRVDATVIPGTQDTASVQAAMLMALARGKTPETFTIVTSGKVRDYRYWSEGTARIRTALGEFDTVVWANQRDGSSRITRVWHAPELGFVPLQAIQFRKGRAEMQMQLVKLER